MAPIHAFATIMGQKGRMDVNHAVGVSGSERLGNEREKSGEDNEGDVIIGLQHTDKLRTCQFFSVDHEGGDAIRLYTRQNSGLGTAAHHQRHVDLGMVGEMSDDVLAVGTTARYKDGKIMLHRRCPNQSRHQYRRSPTMPGRQRRPWHVGLSWWGVRFRALCRQIR